jgi:hypothetical protein
MMVLTTRSADERLDVLGPAKAGLVNKTADIHFPEHHNLPRDIRQGNDLVGFIKALHRNVAHG